MIRVGPGSKNALKAGEVVLSAPAILDSLKIAKLPKDMSEKLYKIGIYAIVPLWKTEAALLLTALSDPSREYIAVLRRHHENIIQIIDKRFEATLARKSDVNSNRFRDQRFMKQTEDEARNVVADLVKFEVKR